MAGQAGAVKTDRKYHRAERDRQDMFVYSAEFDGISVHSIDIFSQL
jgi:hypothetical protein